MTHCVTLLMLVAYFHELVSDHLNPKYSVKTRIITCMWPAAQKLRSNLQRRLLKSFGRVSAKMFFPCSSPVIFNIVC